MTNDPMHNQFWNAVAPGLRRALGLHPLTQVEARQAYADAPEAEISEDEVERLVQHAKSDIPKEPPVSQSNETHPNEILSDEAFLIHRNEGDEQDEEVDDLLDQQRRDALGQDDNKDEEEEDTGS